jgi:hypothetical protein
MDQEFQISNLKLIQDNDGYAIMRLVQPGVFEAIATFKYPEDAITYFANTIMQAIAYKQSQQVDSITMENRVILPEIEEKGINEALHND